MIPPRVPRFLLRLVVEVAERRFVLADLDEEHDAIVASRGRAAARRWYWGQALRSVAPSLGRRLFRRGRRHGAARWRGGGVFRDVMQDVRYGLRGFARVPGFSMVALLTLMLGIGATTAIFSVVNAVLYRPLPFAEPAELVTLWETKLDGERAPSRVSPPNFLDWREQNEAFAGLAALSQGGFVLTGDGGAERVPGMYVSAGFFAMLGTRVERGRSFVPEDERGEVGPVVVVSHTFWASRMGADPAAVGRTVTLDDTPHRIVGVLPPDFQFPDDADLWVPMAFPPEARVDAMRGARYLEVLARMAPGVTLAQAQSSMDALARRLEEHPNNVSWGVAVQPLHEHVVAEFRSALQLIFAAVGFVMLIVCANVANLVIARSAKRAKESAVRTALGASRLRIFRQAVTENTLLALGGGALGVLLAHWTIVPLVRLAPRALPRLDGIRVDATAFAFAVGVSLATGLLLSVLPIVFGSADSNTILRAPRGGSGRQRVRQALIVAEVALSLVLLAGAGLMVRSFQQQRRVDPGFVFEDIMTAAISLPNTRYRTPELKAAFYRDLLYGLSGIDGVRSVGATTNLPMSGSVMTFGVRIEGQDPAGSEQFFAEYHAASEEYFRTMGIPLTAGRSFNAAENAGEMDAVIINETLARRHFGDVEPVGSRLSVVSQRGPVSREIVGVIGNVRHAGLASTPRAEVYVPLGADPWSFVTVAIRASGDTDRWRAAFGAQVARLDAALPPGPVQPMTRLIGNWLAPLRFQMVLVGLFGALAIVLAGIGIYGVISFLVGTRTNEIGVRMALGADGAEVFRLFVRQGLVLAGVGVVLGLGGAAVLVRFVRSLLFQVAPYDPVTFVGISIAVLAVAGIASYVPARRATAVDAVRALRAD